MRVFATTAAMHAELTGIGPYRLTRMLAAEDTMTLYAGFPEGDPDQRVTVAVLHAALAVDPDVASAFDARASVAMRLKGKPIHGVASGRDRGVATSASGTRPWVVWDAVEGVNLEQLIAGKKRFKLPIEAATNLFVALLEALGGAARHRVVHGRLRASDIWLGHEGRIVVTNFGAEDDPRADFLSLARIAQEIGTEWVPEVDAWLDALQQETPPWRNADEARQAFPLTTTEAGRARLTRTVKAAVRKRDEAEGGAVGAGGGHAVVDASEMRDAAGEGRKRPRLRPLSRRPGSPEEAERAAREARRVAIICVAILFLGLALEAF